MTIDKKYIDHFINVTSKAALASSYLIGKKDKIAADQAAVDSMRNELNNVYINGEIVISEGLLQYLVKSWSTIIELISVWKRLIEFEIKLKSNIVYSSEN